ncbi:MAG: class I poly(R)-hydroxyalkanoic acid synthase [Undibacterium sp.]|uniref:class I poly(R)-hydroxyalkanoic acid synthase n=1 Tax=Undibacterium sp. TaxID=1914977 RepID=UPI0027211C6C|nr:class I poly(R)-hydroxyalkanoic acid synthase [Undibacterium sp.]MDO8652989.1 class I poly(R)-hydroxyalkanoic acid synthase [Undibacterium sp.]
MKTYDPQAMYSDWMSQLLNQDKWQEWIKSATTVAEAPMLNVLKEIGAEIDPATMKQLQSEYFLEYGKLWQDFLTSKAPKFHDKRFASSDWHDQVTHSYNVSSYLLNGRFLMSMAEAVQAPEKIRQKIRFAVQQIIDAMSPANFLVSNPEAQAKLIESKGESLVKGISQMLADMQKGRISQTDESAFKVGKNVATTEGAVVFENRLFQLIQYTPLTKTVHQRPLLMVPPCINKFYILDLQPENSVVRYAIEQGHTVFLVSWANPDETMSDVTWDNYIEDGAIKAIQVVREISKQDQINAFGFCVGGTIISTALAALADRGEHPVSSLTLLTTLLDFSDTGILDVFVDEEQVSMREKAIGQGGLMPGRDLASTFSSLRANDLVWSYVQKNYLKGEAPPPFDLLYWNADSTNLPGPMFCWYLRNTYLENSLKKPNSLTVAGNRIDLGKIDTPVFIYGSREDHIVPWQAAFASCALLNPKNKKRNRFILGASGHIAGVVNPPANKKRSYWTNSQIGIDPQKWFENATEHSGSWWPEWAVFLADHGGKMIKAPAQPGNVNYKVLEPAPGRYVAIRAE